MHLISHRLACTISVRLLPISNPKSGLSWAVVSADFICFGANVTFLPRDALQCKARYCDCMLSVRLSVRM